MTSSEKPKTLSKGEPTGRPEMAVRRWSWWQFWCAFVVGGLGGFLHINFSTLPLHLLQTFVVGLACACLAGRYGDPVWGWLLLLMEC